MAPIPPTLSSIPTPQPSTIAIAKRLLNALQPRNPPTTPLHPRQIQDDHHMISIPSTYNSFTSSPGVVVGIVFGVVLGVVLLVYVLFLAFGGNTANLVASDDDGTTVTSTTVTEDTRPPRRTRPSRRRPEVIEVMSGTMSSRSEDVVEVYEEMSASEQSHQPSRYSKRHGEYRTVDPRRFAGGGRRGR
ncbi:hypothetical protein FQN55_002296 [Onygenales sp. PD_40]|nr:hypothetical protein FQN55_002296 [Onygenales sp. PD_40]KAK2786029.1 hypothetical protein FQN52_008025 [Onygenales sp. PD_12]KAK2801578.1 hypothetical protein FQN51_005285 [Onygenales sp. PD_10]